MIYTSRVAHYKSMNWQALATNNEEAKVELRRRII